MDPLGILGAIGVVAQFVQIGVQFGLDWKDAPDAVRSVINELHSLIIVVSETNKRLLCNPDFAAALLTTGSASSGDSKLPDIGLPQLSQELEYVLSELKSREPDRRLNELVTVEAAAVIVGIDRKLVDVMAEQLGNTKITMGIATVTDKIQRDVEGVRTEQQARELLKQEKEILKWLTPIEFSDQQSDLLSKRQPGTGEWLIESEQYRRWTELDDHILFCPGNPGV